MSKPKQPPQVCVSMPTYDLMQVSTCLSLIKLMDKFTMAKIRATVQTFKSPYVGYGRNVLTAMFLETGMDYQLFVDSSIIKKLGIKFWQMVDPFKELSSLTDGITITEEDLLKKKESL